MRHLTRDFLTLSSSQCPGTNMYALGIFLYHVGGFELVGGTNFDLFTSSIQLGSGISGSINFGSGTYEVLLPTASYVLSSQDVGRILVLKSQFHPIANSGLFRISSVDLLNNGAVVDYRSAQSPPPEQYLNWRVFENEITASESWKTTSNGTNNYGSWSPTVSSSSGASRTIWTSPDPSAWQVRMCLDSAHDVSGAVPSGFSIAPGFGGNSAGDFLPLIVPPNPGPGAGQVLHLHGALFYNTTSSLYRGMTVGLTPDLGANGQWRISMMVDDVSGTCAIVNKNVSLPTMSGSGWCVFGLTDDETVPPTQSTYSDPVQAMRRLFVAGSSNSGSNLTWTSQFHADNNMQVVGWSEFGYPIPGVLSSYADISNPGNTHVRYLSSSADTPWMGETELLDVEVLLGTVDVTVSATSSASLWLLQPRRVGKVPMFMQGRANYAQWTVSGDGGWYHTEDGVYMQWGGPVPTGNAVTSSVLVNTSDIELQQGLDPLGAFLPGSDPVVPVVPPGLSDIDATRYRKTYSYYRQVPVNVGVIKGGSNPPKP